MNKVKYLEELTKLLEEAYDKYNKAEIGSPAADYYKGRFHAFNTAILVFLA